MDLIQLMNLRRNLVKIWLKHLFYVKIKKTFFVKKAIFKCSKRFQKNLFFKFWLKFKHCISDKDIYEFIKKKLFNLNQR